MDWQQQSEQAVIIGGSMAGLLTARVLAAFFPQVVILERDCLPEMAEDRKGVPQGRHAHALLARGRQLLEQWFPGLTASLVTQGAPLGHGRLFSGGGYFARHPEAPATLYVSRPCLEAEVRRRVQSLPNVRIIEACDALGVTTSADHRRITGVQLIRREAGAAAEVLPAALVVDASGRGSRTPAWLAALGYSVPEVERVEVGMGYASRLYARKPEHLNGDLHVNIAPTPQNPRACGLLAQEGERWIVTLAGYFGDHPPTDHEGFLAFARKLPAPDVFELLSSATPLSDPVPFRFRANLRRRYERLKDFPEGLLVIGDALCSFTPIYGQGMSVVAMEALALQRCLAAGRHALARRFFGAASTVLNNPWSLTVGNDQRLSGTTLPAPRRLLNGYLGKLQMIARCDPEVSLAFQRVGNLLAAPPSLLHPRIAIRVLVGSLFSGERLPAPQSIAARGQGPVEVRTS